MAKKRRKLKKQFVKLIRVFVLIILFVVLCEVISSFVTKKTFKLVEIHENDYFTNSDFGIVTLTSIYDYDNDGVDDYTDILNGAKKYAEFNPKYVSNTMQVDILLLKKREYVQILFGMPFLRLATI